MAPDGDDLMLPTLVSLVEAQNERLANLRRAVINLQARLQAQRDGDVLLAQEIRAPLAVVCAVLQALEGPVPDDARAELVARALAHAERVATLVNDLLRPIDADGPLVGRSTPKVVRLAQLVEGAVRAVAPRGLDPARVVVDVDPGLEIATAPSRVEAILAHLLDNAATHAPGAAVTVRAAIVPEAAEVVIEVADDGPGLGTDHPEPLLAAYRRGPVPPDRPGRGLGLYLVRLLARSLGGDATVANRQPTGTVARVWLPQRRGDDPVSLARLLADAAPAAPPR
jgi:signal transduction histidine kinase